MSNTVLERIQQVIGNLVQTYNISHTYVDKEEPWSGILAAAALKTNSTTNRKKYYSPFYLIFGHEMILPIKHTVDWELICQRKQTENNNDNIRENRN